MRISTKGRYGLAIMATLAERCGEQLTATDISEKIGVSKIYLEQMLGLLKKAGLVQSVKGSQGGYSVGRNPDDISAYAILAATESALFEKTESCAGSDVAGHIDTAVKKTVWLPLDEAVNATLKNISLQAVIDNSGTKDGYMFYL